MPSSFRPVLIFLSVATVLAGVPLSATAQTPPDLSGKWSLNRALSQFPPEVGFNEEFMPPPTDGREPAAGGHGRRGSGGGQRNFMPRPESADEGNRLRLLTDEAREPPATFTIAQTAAAVTLTDDKGHTRTFHPNGKEEVTDLGGVPAVTITRWDGEQLAILFEVEEGRQIRTAYSRAASPDRVIVETTFIDRGNSEKVSRVYEPYDPNRLPSSTARSASSGPPSSGGAPGNSEPPPGAFHAQAGAEFKGLSTVGLVVEDMGSQAATCGLNQGTMESAVYKHLTATGLQVRRNSDEDTYVYVNINVGNLSNGLCVSRFDVYLTTHTTATLSYQSSPVLVEVTLMHKGSLAGGSPTAHADSVQKGVLEYVDQIAARIHDANPSKP